MPALPDGVGPASVTERSTRGTGVTKSLKTEPALNLVDVGRVRCAPGRLIASGELRADPWVVRPEATVKCCGVAVAMPQGQSRAPPSSSESVVNTGTVSILTPSARGQRGWFGLGPSSTDRVEAGRSRRSSRSPGEPDTGRRAAAVTSSKETGMPKEAPVNTGAPTARVAPFG